MKKQERWIHSFLKSPSWPLEFDELIADTFYKMVNGVNEKAGVYILHTIGTILENYASYRGRDKAPEAYEQRKKVLLGYLMKGLVHFKESISIEALNIIGHELFGSEKLSLDEKCAYFSYIAKHLMSAVGEQSKAALAFYNRASAPPSWANPPSTRTIPQTLCSPAPACT